MIASHMTRRSLLGSAAAVALAGPARAADAGDPIRKLVIVCAAQASDPQEFQAAQLLAQAWRQLGLTIEVRPMPRLRFPVPPKRRACPMPRLRFSIPPKRRVRLMPRVLFRRLRCRLKNGPTF